MEAKSRLDRYHCRQILISMPRTTIGTIINCLEKFAPPVFQESYDNSGLLIGEAHWECTGALCTLDTTLETVSEAIAKGCNLIVCHHPLIFGGIKKIDASHPTGKTLIEAIKHDIAIYAVHTNADNIIHGVNHRIATLLGLEKTAILAPKKGLLAKLITFVPGDHLLEVRQALFQAGAGHIGNYSSASFSHDGTGTFKGNENTKPYVGEKGTLHEEAEKRLEVIFPLHLHRSIVSSLKAAHPYEEVAFDIVKLENEWPQVGSGLTGYLPEAKGEKDFFETVSEVFELKVLKHTRLLGKPVNKVAVCGGAGIGLLGKAIANGADVYITSDVKYHEFFDADGKIVLVDIGHWESEQFTAHLFKETINRSFPTFAVFTSNVCTNPVRYFF